MIKRGKKEWGKRRGMRNHCHMIVSLLVIKLVNIVFNKIYFFFKKIFLNFIFMKENEIHLYIII